MKRIIAAVLLALAATGALAQSYDSGRESAFSNDHNFIAPPQ